MVTPPGALPAPRPALHRWLARHETRNCTVRNLQGSLAPGRLRLQPRHGPRAADVRAAPSEPPAAAAAPAPGPAAPAEVDHVALVKEALARHDKVLVAQTAPAVRVSIGEEVGLPPGTAVTGKLVTALRRLGFDYVFDVLVGADLTIMEEGSELLARLIAVVNGLPGSAPLPLFTSCCPGWVAYVENCAPELIPHLSTAKSPQMMMGAVIKNIFSQRIGRRPEDLLVVSVMPCVRKQGEADRLPYQTHSGARDVDHVLTTRDLGALLREAGLDLAALPDSPHDDFLGEGTGAAALFGTTGGVMEASLRTVYELCAGEALPRLEFEAVRGLEGVRTAAVTVPPAPAGPLHNAEPVTLRVAVANGLGNAKKLLKEVAAGALELHAVEVMACPGGCIGGGGQPRSADKEVLRKRQEALYAVDQRSRVRRSHESPVVQELYRSYLGQPLSPVAEELLHTRYTPCGPPKFDITAPPPPPGAAPHCPLQEPAECDTSVCGVCGEDWDRE